MELLLLDHFSWNVDLPTAASFVDMFLVHSVLEDDSHSGRPLNNCTKARVYVKKYVHYFLEISLQGTLIEQSPVSDGITFSPLLYFVL
jgi:hypothetical protein